MGKILFALFNASAAIIMGALFVACLDIPNAPATSSAITKVSVSVKQFGKQDSSFLKINSTDSSTLIAQVHPSTYKNQVSYYWFNNEDLLDSGSIFPISSSIAQSGEIGKLFIPNRLVIQDSEGNSIEKEFQVFVNAPPTLGSNIIPADGDTIRGDVHTAILFKWNSFDDDRNQQLTHTLEIDGTAYTVGNLLQVEQSGFKEGKHTFRILVIDPMGDRDSTLFSTFYVMNSNGSKP